VAATRPDLEIVCYDPSLSSVVQPVTRLAATADEAIECADVVAVLTEWPEFAFLNYRKHIADKPGLSIYDTRNVIPVDATLKVFRPGSVSSRKTS
jgi:UDP-N-acetyl-D-mannosaminuronate dehydrogenase